MAKLSKITIRNWLRVKTDKLAKTKGKPMSRILIMKDDVPGYVNICDMEVATLAGIPSILYIGDEVFMLHGQYPNAVYYPATTGILKPVDVEWNIPHIESGKPQFRKVK